MYLHISVAKHELHLQKRGKGVERGRDSCSYEKKEHKWKWWYHIQQQLPLPDTQRHTFPDFHLISVDFEDGSPLSFRWNSLERTLFSKYGFSSKYCKVESQRLELTESNRIRAKSYLVLNRQLERLSDKLQAHTQPHSKKQSHKRRSIQSTYKIYSVTWFDVFKFCHLNSGQIMQCLFVFFSQQCRYWRRIRNSKLTKLLNLCHGQEIQEISTAYDLKSNTFEPTSCGPFF